MPEEDSRSNGASNGARLRRPVLERTEPRRGWGNLYAPGKVDAAREPLPSQAADAPAAEAPHREGSADAAARVVRDGYRVVEENLRRGRQVAAELRGVRREVADFAGRVDAQKFVTELTRTVIDPALTEQVLGVARTLLSAVGSVVPTAAASANPAATPEVALHPQARPAYAPAGARVLKLRSIAPGEWLADMEIDGQVRRVQLRAVDGEL
jgi:hypothetical protein